MQKVVIYTGPICNFCSAAKHLLSKKKISYEEIDIGNDDKKREEMLKFLKTYSKLHGEFAKSDDVLLDIEGFHLFLQYVIRIPLIHRNIHFRRSASLVKRPLRIF